MATGKGAAPRALVLVDLDGTLIDQSYRLTVPGEELASALAEVSAAGALLGISSDSSLERIARFAAEHGIVGPVVAERGAVWAPSPDRLGEAETSRPDAAGFARARDIFAADLSSDPSVMLEVGDVNRRSRDLIGAAASAGFSRAVLVNGERRGSLSFYALESVAGRWQLSAALLGEMADRARAAVAAAEPSLVEALDVDLNERYGVAIFHVPNTGKTLAVPALRSRFGDLPIYVVGDSDADWHHAPNVAHCAVGNAAESFRAAADFAATGPVAAGAVECFRWIAARLRGDSLTAFSAERSVNLSSTGANQ